MLQAGEVVQRFDFMLIQLTLDDHGSKTKHGH